MQRDHFWGPCPLGPWGWAKRSNIIKSELQSQFQGVQWLSGSLTRDRRAAGSSLTGVTALWSLSKTHLS